MEQNSEREAVLQIVRMEPLSIRSAIKVVAQVIKLPVCFIIITYIQCMYTCIATYVHIYIRTYAHMYINLHIYMRIAFEVEKFWELAMYVHSYLLAV